MVVERWTDEMLDELASSVSEQRESITEMRESITEIRESIRDQRDSIDGLKVTSQALLQIAAQNQRDMELVEEEMELMKQRQAENDQRFKILLEEVRHLSRRIKDD
ncbi:MAG: hypothetical protein F6K10_05505 [Moorea sp. SIO2B7]|nr:hypothetical protein [Moorena sp. SIO2B7]